MYGLFSQGKDGFHWLSTHEEIAEANEAVADAISNGGHDALFVIKLADFTDCQS